MTQAQGGPLRVILYGCGEIGQAVGRFLITRQGVALVGAVDKDPALVGRDVGEVLNLGRRLGLAVTADPAGLLSSARPQMALHATGSYLREVYPQLAELVAHGVNVISTCEELAYPAAADAELAAALDALAREHGVAVLGTGINPGFVMDTLPILLTTVCQRIDRITVKRVMNAATRRLAFQKKIGAGLTPEEFRKRMGSGSLSGHVGLKQSLALLAAAIGWELDDIRIEEPHAVIAAQAVSSPFLRVEAGQVAGLRQKALALVGDRAAIVLEFEAYLGAPEEYDSISIEGVPPIHQRISPCVHGDLATTAIVVNLIPRVMAAAPGLLTMKDLPLPSAAPQNLTVPLNQLKRDA